MKKDYHDSYQKKLLSEIFEESGEIIFAHFDHFCDAWWRNHQPRSSSESWHRFIFCECIALIGQVKFLFAHEDSSVVVLRVDPEASKKSDSSKSSDLNRSRSYSVKTESRTANTVGGMGSWNKGQILGQTLTSKRFKVKSYIHILIGPKSSYWA